MKHQQFELEETYRFHNPPRILKEGFDLFPQFQEIQMDIGPPCPMILGDQSMKELFV